MRCQDSSLERNFSELLNLRPEAPGHTTLLLQLCLDSCLYDAYTNIQSRARKSLVQGDMSQSSELQEGFATHSTSYHVLGPYGALLAEHSDP